MPQYYFHTRDGAYVIDDVGTELPSDAAAKIEAARLIGTLVSDDPDQIWADGSFHLEVTREDGSIVCGIACSAVAGPPAWGPEGDRPLPPTSA